MILKSSEFVTSAVNPEHYPKASLPEVAFAGRSNVGKSSLINTLLNRKKLVKTSSTPGRTQLINFFDINKEFTFVDLPGYGYAKVPKKVKKDWGQMIETYITKRETLRCVILLLDVRRTPGKEEFDIINWLDQNMIPYLIVLTKADKFSNQQREKQYKKIAKTLEVDKKELTLFSSKSRLGKDVLWNKIEHYLALDTIKEGK
ncbi:MAG: YihA family ribosome biogenesis GTP-binding protein [Desulfobacterales bacterium]|nr:YihA family ribosome biogenesis GTP-binding protein [Desulfobacterales bacterium]MCP4164022.1 YihA family ribosome biogenesis GTP-binding protein [Deltaproteobacteria bacterium]